MNVYKLIYTMFLVRGDIVQMCRDIAMITVGALGVLAYQKYKEPLKKKMNCLMDTAMDRVDDKLEQMR